MSLKDDNPVKFTNIALPKYNLVLSEFNIIGKRYNSPLSSNFAA